MENASDALIMAFAVLIFVGALSILFYQMTVVKSAADVVFLYRDKTNFYTYENNSSNDKIVGKDIVISTLYRLSKDRNESFAVIIQKKDGTTKETYDLATISATSTSSVQEILNAKIQNFIKDNKCDTFIEKYVSTTTSGNYLKGDDGTVVTITPGGTKIYIIYIEQN